MKNIFIITAVLLLSACALKIIKDPDATQQPPQPKQTIQTVIQPQQPVPQPKPPVPQITEKPNPLDDRTCEIYVCAKIGVGNWMPEKFKWDWYLPNTNELYFSVTENNIEYKKNPPDIDLKNKYVILKEKNIVIKTQFSTIRFTRLIIDIYNVDINTIKNTTKEATITLERDIDLRYKLNDSKIIFLHH